MAIREKTQYVIIGGSAAGMAAAQAIRETDAGGEITVLSAETDRPYFRPLIPYLISGKKRAHEMMMLGRGPYTAEDIRIYTGATVAAIDTERKTVLLAGKQPDDPSDDRWVPYHRLLIATGSTPHVPPEIEGTDATGVFALRTLAHARAAARRVGTARHAVMLGGGLLNLKAAFALLECGLRVTLVVYSPEVLSQLMTPADAARIRRALETAGLKIVTGCAATAVERGSGGVTGVVLDDGRTLGCEMVFIGKGVVPCTDFLTGSGICIDGGVVADSYTATNATDVFTAGDVAVTVDPVTGQSVNTGLWTNAVEMGRCAGLNMACRATRYAGTLGIMNATQIADEPFVSMGIVHTDGNTYEIHRASGDDFYRKLVFSPDGNRLVGAVLSGDIAGAGLLRSVIRERLPMDGLKQAIVSGRLNYGYFVR